jgi:hypothetical protein
MVRRSVRKQAGEVPALVLLGAGASVEAGVPSAKKLASELYQAVKTVGEPEAKAMRAVLAGLHTRRSVVAEDPFGEVDVEDLYDGLVMLATRRSHPLGPFVSVWHPTVAEADLPDFRRAAADVSEALANLLTNSMEDLAKRIENSVLSKSRRHDPTGVGVMEATPFWRTLQHALEVAAGLPGQESVFRSAAKKMVKQLVPRVWVRDPTKVEYLRPMVRSARRSNLRIATLNYDNTVEVACDQAGISIDVGVQNGKREIAFRQQANVQLAKLHGSLDWHIEPTGEVFKSKTPEVDGPGLIFGGGNKLRVEGPFLDLLMTFRRWLNEADRVLVVGYSFRDRHVNHLLLGWLSDDPGHTIIVVDPSLEASTIHANIDAAWGGEQHLAPDVVRTRFKIERTAASDGLKAHFPKEVR